MPVRAVRLGPRDVVSERKPDGTIRLTSPHALAPYPAKLTERLQYWAAAAPERTFLAQRAALGWRKISYGETLEQVRRIGAALLRRDLSPGRPIAILSGNDIEHALMGLAAIYIGIPYAPISPAYSLISMDFGRLRSIIDLISPGLVFAADGDSYARAIETAVRPQAASASPCISSNTDCDSAAPANHSTLSRLKNVSRSRASARKKGSSAS